VQPGKLLETLRDRVVLRSQIGKRKLDRSVVRRELDDVLRRLGERYRALVKARRVEVPGELTLIDEAVARLEERLAEQDREIAALEAERPRT
jgi:aryl-alcohol dehydrogenase-like predicted oxidoreductase